MKNIKYMFLILLLIIILAYLGYEKTPKIKIYYGENIQQKQKIYQSNKYEILIENKGKKDLIIHDIDTSCNCTQYTLSENEIKPKQFSTLSLIIRNDKPEDVNKKINIKIHSNDPKNNILNLDLQIKIKNQYIIEPKEFFDFRHIEYGNLPSKTITIKKENGDSFNILDIEHQKKEIACDIVKEENKYLVSVKFVEIPESGVFYDILAVKTDIKEQPIINLPVTANIDDIVEIKPNPIFLGMVKSGEMISKKLNISYMSKEIEENIEFKLIDDLKKNVELVKEGNDYFLKYIVLQDRKGFYNNKYKFTTNIHQKPEIRLTVSAFVTE